MYCKNLYYLLFIILFYYFGCVDLRPINIDAINNIGGGVSQGKVEDTLEKWNKVLPLLKRERRSGSEMEPDEEDDEVPNPIPSIESPVGIRTKQTTLFTVPMLHRFNHRMTDKPHDQQFIEPIETDDETVNLKVGLYENSIKIPLAKDSSFVQIDKAMRKPISQELISPISTMDLKVPVDVETLRKAVINPVDMISLFKEIRKDIKKSSTSIEEPTVWLELTLPNLEFKRLTLDANKFPGSTIKQVKTFNRETIEGVINTLNGNTNINGIKSDGMKEKNFRNPTPGGSTDHKVLFLNGDFVEIDPKKTLKDAITKITNTNLDKTTSAVNLPSTIIPTATSYNEQKAPSFYQQDINVPIGRPKGLNFMDPVINHEKIPIDVGLLESAVKNPFAMASFIEEVDKSLVYKKTDEKQSIWVQLSLPNLEIKNIRVEGNPGSTGEQVSSVSRETLDRVISSLNGLAKEKHDMFL